jgi:uncharacterized protein (TIGR00297 family)
MLPSFFTHALAHGWAHDASRIALATATTVAFAALARALRGVNASGAIAGGILCFFLFAGAGPVAFAALAILFVLTWMSTRFGSRRKQALGVAERREGRNAGQVFANLAAPALCSVMFSVTGYRAWIVAMIATLAEAATDTVASEVGQAGSGRARLITTWEVVPAGIDGGITLGGTLAGVLGGLLITLVAVEGGLIAGGKIGGGLIDRITRETWIPLLCGIAGMFFDSLLGATIQRRGWISNQGVNLAATLASAALGYFLSL